MENIKQLKTIPEKLLKADNVSYVVIDGMRLDKRMMIGKAKKDALTLMQYREYLKDDAVEELLYIISL